MKNDGVLERLRKVAQDEKNPNAAAARWGLDASSLAKQLRGERGVSVATLQAVLSARDDVDAEWLLMGTQGRGHDDSEEGLPLIPIEAAAGLTGGDSDNGVRLEDCKRYDVPGLEGYGAEMFMRVSGWSMCPTLNDGDVLAVHRIYERHEIKWGRMYVIDSLDGAYVKRLVPGTDKHHVTCHSDNPRYHDFTLPFDEIRALWDVVGLIHGV